MTKNEQNPSDIVPLISSLLGLKGLVKEFSGKRTKLVIIFLLYLLPCITFFTTWGLFSCCCCCYIVLFSALSK